MSEESQEFDAQLQKEQRDWREHKAEIEAEEFEYRKRFDKDGPDEDLLHIGNCKKCGTLVTRQEASKDLSECCFCTHADEAEEARADLRRKYENKETD